MSHWTCKDCQAEGQGFLPDECPNCAMCNLAPTPEGLTKMVEAAAWLQSRAEDVTNILVPDADYADFRHGGGTTFEVRWSRWYSDGSRDSGDETLPVSYLLLSDEKIRAEKAAIQAKKAAEEKARQVAEAERQLKLAREKAAFAQRNADAEVRRYQEQLDKLKA